MLGAHAARCASALAPTATRRPALPLRRKRQPLAPAAAPDGGPRGGSAEPVFLSDLIAFESDIERGGAPGGAPSGGDGGDPTARVQEIIDRATKVLEAARQALGTEEGVGGPGPSPPGAAAASPSSGSGPQTPSNTPAMASTDSPAGLAAAGAAAPVRPGGGKGAGGPGGEALTRRWGPLSEERDLTRHVLQSALDEMQRTGGGSNGSGGGRSSVGGGGAGAFAPGDGSGPVAAGASGGGDAAPPTWAASFLSSPQGPQAAAGAADGAGGAAPAPRLQAAVAPAPPSLVFADPEPPPAPTAALLFVSQEEQDRAKARAAVLPPLQSIVELTSAFRPPERGAGAIGTEDAPAIAPAAAGRALADGSGALPDGSTWEKRSGVEYGKNGYWKRWHLLRGTAAGGVEWEETWWEASDWTGFREMGAEKRGNDAAGGAWHESWTERLVYVGADLDSVVERNAHKWAHAPGGDEWEEKWGEYYHAGGKVDKWADKWGKQGPNVWHERWGEDYDGAGAVVKWTDKWAERLLPGGAREQWGDKWHEAFASGRGEKNGEVWSVDAGGGRYQRWWGEQHPGDGSVRRYGHSTSGESWDERVAMDTYYNPVPHFGYALALAHSPQLRNVPLRPKDVGDADDPFGPGVDDL